MGPAARAVSKGPLDPLVVHTHIPKTGGTSLRQLVTQNYRQGQLVNLDRSPTGAPMRWHRATDWQGVVDWHHDYYRSLPASRRAEIRCFEGHSAPFLISAVDDRPVRAFCMLRDPVELVISYYLFSLREAGHAGSEWPGVPMVNEMRARGWGLKDVYRELAGSSEVPTRRFPLFLPLFNGQARHVLLGTMTPTDIPFHTSGEAVERYRERAFEVLSRHYVVGTQDRFSQSVRLFADSFGWSRVFVPRVNVGPVAAKVAEIDREARSAIRAHNRIDADLHAHYSRSLAAMPVANRVRHARGRAGLRARRAVRRARRRMQLQSDRR